MKVRQGSAICTIVLLWACQSARVATVTIAADGQAIRIETMSRVPRALLRQAGIDLGPQDVVLERGYEVDPDAAIPAGRPIQLQVRRSVPVLFNGAPLQSSSRTVGEVLHGEGIELGAADLIDPPVESTVSAGLIIALAPSTPAGVALDGGTISVRLSAERTEAALAEAGLPVIGLDTVLPAESRASPEPASFKLSRVSEKLELAQEPIPFESLSQDSSEIELGVEQLLQPGRTGLAVSRTRIRYSDGVETNRQVEPQVVVRPPMDRLVAHGTKIVENTTTIDGQTISYWRVLQMYATVYSPCNSGSAAGSCSSGTSSGLPAGKGVVAVDPDLYAFLNGQRLYIPGYGYAVVGDVGGGYIIEQKLGISRYKWIDLGFPDNDIQDMTGWVTVYFLTPAPASIPEVLK